MKKLILVLFLISLIAFPCLSQTDSDSTKDKINKTYFGFIGGISRTSLYGSYIDNYLMDENGQPDGRLQYRKAPVAGFFIKRDFASFIYGKIGLNFLSKGGGVIESENIIEPQVSFYSLNMPVQVGLSTSNANSLKASIEIGLGFNYELGSNKEELITSAFSTYTIAPNMFVTPIELLIGGNIEYDVNDDTSFMLNYRFFKDDKPFYKRESSTNPSEIFVKGSIWTFGIVANISSP